MSYAHLPQLEPVRSLALAALFGPPKQRPEAVDAVAAWLSAAALSGLDAQPLGCRLAVLAENALAEDRARHIAVLTAWESLLSAVETAGEADDLRALRDVQCLVMMGGAKAVTRALAPLVEPVRAALRDLPPQLVVTACPCGEDHDHGCENGRVTRLVGGNPEWPVERACPTCKDDHNAGVDTWELRRLPQKGERRGKLLGALSAREHNRADVERLAEILAPLADDQVEVVIDLVADCGDWPADTADALRLAAEAEGGSPC